MPTRKRVTGRYDYRDATGKLMYWKERIEPGPNGSAKEFRFYHGKRESGRGCDSIPYHLPDIVRSKAVIITEGEKHADLLRSWGLCATSLDSGASSRLPKCLVEVLTGKRIAILRDNDEPGLKYAETITKSMAGQYESMRVVLLPGLEPKGDVCDWVKDPQNDKARLLSIIKETPEWIAPPEEPKKERRTIKREHKDGDISSEMIEVAKQFPIDEVISFHQGKALCISHKEKTPSMTIFKNKACCHGCGKSFSSIDAVMIMDGLNFVEAVKQLAGGG